MKKMTSTAVALALLGLSSFAFANTPKKAESKAQHITGTFVSEDAAKNEVTVTVKQKGKTEEMVFVLQPSAKIELAGKTAALGDLQKGETVKLSYTKEGTARNATELSAQPLPVKKAATSKKENKKG